MLAKNSGFKAAWNLQSLGRKQHFGVVFVVTIVKKLLLKVVENCDQADTVFDAQKTPFNGLYFVLKIFTSSSLGS